MTIGELRERVTFQRRTEAVDSAGSVSLTWATAATVWARMEPVSASRPMVAERPEPRARWRLTIRYRSDLTSVDRVTWRSRTFDLDGPARNADERRRYLVFDLLERTAP